jgi:hypothetical protein
MFKPLKLHAPINKPRSIKGFPFEYGLRNILVKGMGSYVEGSKNPMTHTSTPKFVEEVVAEVM